jgi:hypothetical protein
MGVSYVILYGYDKNTFTRCSGEENTKVILLEPRSQQIDLFNKDKDKIQFKNYKLISKALSTIHRGILYSNKDGIYSLDTKMEDYIKREEVFCTMLSKIIEEENIQNITNVVFNIPIQNLNETLSDFNEYSHIISKVTLDKRTNYKISSMFQQKSEDDTYIFWENKNINIELPRICLYSINSEIKNQKEFIKMLKQYDIDFMDENDENIFVIQDPQEIDFSRYNRRYAKYNISDMQNKLIKIFKKDYYDIIVQFNANYFLQKNSFQLFYPTNDNTLYIQRQNDIIYGTGKCMFKLYRTMCSPEYKEHMNKKLNERPKLFNLFERRYFYDYISSVFQIIEVK